jgi:cytochrome c551/c552
MTRITTRYVVRNARGEELVVPSLSDVHALYAGGFLEDADLVRQERSDRWTPAGELPALHGVRQRRRESPLRVTAVVAALMALALALGIMFAR